MQLTSNGLSRAHRQQISVSFASLFFDFQMMLAVSSFLIGSACDLGSPSLSFRASGFFSKTPDYFQCPITHCVMQNPVVVRQSGITYEKAAIIVWLNQKGTDPSTGLQCTIRDLVPNRALREAIDAWITQADIEVLKEVHRLNVRVNRLFRMTVYQARHLNS